MNRRPVMPEVVVDVRTPQGGRNSPLMLIYGEAGSDPLRSGTLAPDQRIAQCQTVGSRCVSPAARREFAMPRQGPQSLQIRLFNGAGNPIVGAVTWSGSWHPSQVRLTCDLRITDVRSACAVSSYTA
ncbi:hypothetical protein [Sphingomonas sp. BK580]|uniref:hypothetical protein n=1 Tax=Sphingomonas sp. BK580 TaxID=2586972 RepID=UPI0016219F84|nr:hypothetical protein [Sphingomonas sp. BK580]MBB3694851.1 hypothetical protein [Sphingomonas sp. BK580]